jgi:hypothetical protein
MCFFLTIAVPSQHADRISEAFGRGFQISASTNPSVAAALPARYEARLVTSGMCSCGLYARPNSVERADPATHLRRKYEKLGWSEAKIERAIEQAAASASKSNPPNSGIRADVIKRLGTLCHAAGSVAILVHFYNGDVESERLTLGQPIYCGCDDLAARAQTLDEDQVLIASSRRRGQEIANHG